MTPYNTWFLRPTRVSPKRYLDRFSGFCTTHLCDQHTDTETTLRATSVAIGRIYAMRELRPNNNNNNKPRTGTDGRLFANDVCANFKVT